MAKRKVNLPDPLSPAERSARMAKVRSTRNRSTEMRVAGVLIRAGVRGWLRHCRDIPGRPDFYFPAARLAVFVDGCFWHGCRRCRRNMPATRAEFWAAKISANRLRDRRVKRQLAASGVRALRIWEHELRDRNWLAKIRAALGD
jgi:DNA mismatch endonuclease (patch repair protein)